MVKIIVGYVLATFYGMGAFLVLGYEGLLNTPQVDVIFWGLIASGFTVHIIELVLCKPVCRILNNNHLSVRWMSCCHS
ncbi:MAG: hypothetical protein HQL71_07810 [Magnetococcales bacterium]|nr:hypothetical protein [Magnetococcales bacterium]